MHVTIENILSFASQQKRSNFESVVINAGTQEQNKKYMEEKLKISEQIKGTWGTHYNFIKHIVACYDALPSDYQRSLWVFDYSVDFHKYKFKWKNILSGDECEDLLVYLGKEKETKEEEKKDE